MRTLAAGTNALRMPPPLRLHRPGGFTLIELMVVVAIMAIVTAGVGLALRDSSETQLEREAQRLAALLESARAQSRISGNPVRWRPTSTGFVIEGLAPSAPTTPWLDANIHVPERRAIVLGPEPIIPAQRIRLVSTLDPSRSLTLATDGVKPFAVRSDAATTP
jgi:general secretion pathway protein H